LTKSGSFAGEKPNFVKINTAGPSDVRSPRSVGVDRYCHVVPGWLTARRWRPLRWTLLAVLLIGLLTAWLLGPPVQCRDAATDTGVYEVCEPVSLTSPVFWVLLVVAGLLLVPDFAEVQLGGVLGLRRDLAETQTKIALVQRDLTELNLTAARAAASAVSATAAQAASTADVESHLHLHLERQAETAAAVQAARAAQPGMAARRLPGVYASAAMHAGMLGLAGFFPQWCGPVQVLGLTLGKDGLEVTHDYFGVRGPERDRIMALLAEPTGEVSVDVDQHSWVTASRALDDDGRVVGALGVVLSPTELPSRRDIRQERLEELAASVETAARTYARLLVDLLGERPEVTAGSAGVPATSRQDGAQ
jgi:hypothetical protein